MDLVGRTIGGYRLTAVLGKGGMGTVYRAEGAGGRPVAVKVLEKSEHAKLLERFRREAELLARVGGHPHIVAIHAAGEEAQHPYIVMELVEGGALEPPLQDAYEAARIVEEVARATEHLHGLGIIHRDIKPGNVLVGADGRARLTDFGLARELARTTRVTGMGQVVGTPFYMAPEMLTGDNEDRLGPASDVYALGALLFACLVGRPPFEARTLAELVSLVLHFPAPSPSKERPGVPRDLDAVVARALAKDPADRYPSALELARDLERFRKGESVAARPVGSLRLLVRRARREPRRAAIVVSACLLTLAAGPLARLGWIFFDARVARARAEERRARVAEEAKATAAAAMAQAKISLDELANGGDPARAVSRARASLQTIDGLSTTGETGERLRTARARLLLAIARASHASGDDTAAHESLVAALGEASEADTLSGIAEAAAAADDAALAESALGRLTPAEAERPAGRRARAIVLVAGKKYRDALSLLGPASSADPELLAAYASALLGTGDADGCLAALKIASRSRTATAAERRLEARARAARGEEVEAALAFGQAVLLAPRDVALAVEHARWLIARGEPERALAAVSLVRYQAPVPCDLVSARASLLQGDVEAAIATVESACASERRERREALLLRSRIARGLGAPAETWGHAALDLSIHDDERGEAALELGRAALAEWAAGHAPSPIARPVAAAPDPLLSRAREAFDIAAASAATRVAARAGLARIAIARGEIDRAAPLLADAEEDADAACDLLLARAERALAANDPAALEEVRVRGRALRLAEEATPLAPALVAWPRRDETFELARSLEEASLRWLTSVARTRNETDLRRGSESLEIAAALAPTPRRLALLARARLLGARPVEALALAWRASLVDPGAAGAARTFLEAALEADSGLDAALEASSVLLAKDELGPDETVALVALRARVHLRKGDTAAARRELERAARERPLPAVLRALAAVERRAGDGVSAEQHETSARALEKELAELAPRQEALAHDAATQAGEPLTNRRAELEPYRARTYMARSVYRIQSWDVAGGLLDWARNSALEGSSALEFLDWVFREKERTGTPAFDPAKVRERIARDHADRSLRAYASGLAELLGYETGITDDDPVLRVSGSLRLAEAARSFDRVLALDPEAHCALVFRARAFQRLGRREAARADLEKSLELGGDPEALARYFLATVRAQDGNLDAAMKQLLLSRGWQNVKLRAQQDPDLRVLRERSAEFLEWLKQP